MYKKEDYLKLIVGGFTVGLLFLIACVHFNGIGVEKGYEFAYWLVENNQTLNKEMNIVSYYEYRLETQSEYYATYDNYLGQKNSIRRTGKIIQSTKTELYSPRIEDIDNNYFKSLSKKE